MILATDYPLLGIFESMLVFFLWAIWIFVVITILIDVFGRRDLSGWGKAGWTVFVVILPWLGALVYLITQGKGMAERKAV